MFLPHSHGEGTKIISIMKLIYKKPEIEIVNATAQPFMENISIGVGNGAQPGGGPDDDDAFAKEKKDFGDDIWGD